MTKKHDPELVIIFAFRLQVAAKYMPVSAIICGVDLDPIKPIRNVQTFVGDITTQKCRQELRGILKEYSADVYVCRFKSFSVSSFSSFALSHASRISVLHDGAPNVGSQWTKDAYNQAELTLHALKLAVEFRGPNGVLLLLLC